MRVKIPDLIDGQESVTEGPSKFRASHIGQIDELFIDKAGTAECSVVRM